MNAVPAVVAGVKEVIMCVPTASGVIPDLVFAAAAISGVNTIFNVGGAQAIAALAFGTESIPQVDKIVGPGNAYVAEAKRQVFGSVGIDMIAGPSEILIIADETSNADWVAMDLFSQAEHDEFARAILVSTSDAFISAVHLSIERLLPQMPRKEIIEKSLNKFGLIIKVDTLNQACNLSNKIAPEHLELSVDNPADLVEKIINAGSIFLGKFSSESLGDYCAGPNHVLPTSGSARFSSGLSVYDFLKRTSVISISEVGAKSLGKIASVMARGETLIAHAKSAEFRTRGSN
jgi:histidinol dehydrogenase